MPNPNLDLQAGLFAEAELVVDPDAKAIVVPASAVSRFAGVQKVWMIAAGVACQQTVRTGREENGRVEIVEGLPAGTPLALNAADGHDGPVVADGVAPEVEVLEPGGPAARGERPGAGRGQPVQG